jgi:hypothetical protein
MWQNRFHGALQNKTDLGGENRATRIAPNAPLRDDVQPAEDHLDRNGTPGRCPDREIHYRDSSAWGGLLEANTRSYR